MLGTVGDLFGTERMRAKAGGREGCGLGLLW